MIFEAKCRMVLPLVAYDGKLQVSETNIFYYVDHHDGDGDGDDDGDGDGDGDSSGAQAESAASTSAHGQHSWQQGIGGKPAKDRQWRARDLREVHGRR